MLGHKRITTIQIYAKITNDKIERDMDALTVKPDGKFRMVAVNKNRIRNLQNPDSVLLIGSCYFIRIISAAASRKAPTP